MFIRIKPSSNSDYKKAKLFENILTGNHVSQKIVRHIRTAHNNLELEYFIRLGHHIKAQVEEENATPLIITRKISEDFLEKDGRIKTPSSIKGMSGGPLYTFSLAYDKPVFTIFGIVSSGSSNSDYGILLRNNWTK